MSSAGHYQYQQPVPGNAHPAKNPTQYDSGPEALAQAADQAHAAAKSPGHDRAGANDVDAIKSAVGATAQQASDDVRAQAAHAERSTAEAAKKTQHGIMAGIDAVKGGVSSAAASVRDMSATVTDKVRDAVGAAQHSIRDTTATAATSVRQAVDPVAARAADQASATRATLARRAQLEKGRAVHLGQRASQWMRDNGRTLAVVVLLAPLSYFLLRTLAPKAFNRLLRFFLSWLPMWLLGAGIAVGLLAYQQAQDRSRPYVNNHDGRKLE